MIRKLQTTQARNHKVSLEVALNRTNLTDLYKMWGLAESVQNDLATTLRFPGSLAETKDPSLHRLRESIRRLNQFNSSTGEMLSAEEITRQAIAFSEKYKDYTDLLGPKDRSEHISKHLNSVKQLKTLREMVSTRICSDTSPKSLKADLFLKLNFCNFMVTSIEP